MGLPSTELNLSTHSVAYLKDVTMGVPARFHDYAAHTYKDSHPWERNYIHTSTSGKVTTGRSQGAVTVETGSCNRTDYTKNPIRKTSTGMTYRDDSTKYHRNATTYEVTPGEQSRTSTDWSGTLSETYSGHYKAFSAGVDGLWTYPCNPNTGGWNPQYLYDGRARARTECLNKIQAGAVDLSVMVGEARQTSEMLVQSMTRLGMLLRAVKNRRFGDIPKNFGIVKESAKVYLEYRYGWEPLVRDCYDLYKITQGALMPEQIVHEQRQIIEPFHRERKANNSLRNIRQQATVTSRCTIHARLGDVWRRSTQSIGVVNPAVVTWEVIPWSFVVDWGLPVGNFLSALTASNGLEFMWGSEHQIIEADVSADIVWSDNHTGTPMTVSGKGFSFTREGFRNFPRPLLYAKSPFSSRHLDNALALWLSLRSLA